MKVNREVNSKINLVIFSNITFNHLSLPEVMLLQLCFCWILIGSDMNQIIR